MWPSDCRKGKISSKVDQALSRTLNRYPTKKGSLADWSLAMREHWDDRPPRGWYRYPLPEEKAISKLSTWNKDRATALRGVASTFNTYLARTDESPSRKNTDCWVSGTAP